MILVNCKISSEYHDYCHIPRMYKRFSNFSVKYLRMILAASASLDATLERKLSFYFHKSASPSLSLSLFLSLSLSLSFFLSFFLFHSFFLYIDINSRALPLPSTPETTVSICNKDTKSNCTHYNI